MDAREGADSVKTMESLCPGGCEKWLKNGLILQIQGNFINFSQMEAEKRATAISKPQHLRVFQPLSRSCK